MEEVEHIRLLSGWLERFFIDTGITIPVDRLLGWTSRMTPQEHELFLSYKWYIDAMEDVIVLIDGAENPVGIAKDQNIC
jgi:hypothetical protein